MREHLWAAESELWVSAISVWELVLLLEKKRLATSLPIGAWIHMAREQLDWRDAAVSSDVAQEAAHLILPYRDPSDRLLLATARWYGLKLVTADERLLAHGGDHVMANR